MRARHRGVGASRHSPKCPHLLSPVRWLMSDQTVLFRTLTKFSRTLTGPYDVSDVLYELTSAVMQILRTAGAGVSVADQEGTLRFASATDETTTEVEQAQQDSQQGPCHQAYVS